MTRSILNLAADFQKQLAATVAISDTTCTLSSYTDSDGVPLVNNRLYGFTVDTGSKKEYIIGTHIAGAISGIVSISRQGAATSGFQKTHQVGASIFITDWATLSRITNLLAGTTDFDSGVQLKYDGAPAQTEANAFATIQYVLDTASGSTVLAFNPLTIEGQATNVTNGDWVFFDEATGLWEKTDASASATSVGVLIGKARGTVSATVPAGIAGGIFVAGSETVGTYTAGQEYYLSNTAGALSTSAGDNSVLVGVGDENGNLVMKHVYPKELTVDEKAALAGTSGTPSASNKFVTQAGIDAITTPIARAYTTSGSPHTWTKPAGLKYVVVELVGGGGAGRTGGDTDGNQPGGGGGGAGGYSRKLIAAGSLGATETVTIGVENGTTSFGAHLQATGGSDADFNGGAGGVGSGGDVNSSGGAGSPGNEDNDGGCGGNSYYGGGGLGSSGGSVSGGAGGAYGGGGGGGGAGSSSQGSGGAGASGFCTLTEYYV